MLNKVVLQAIIGVLPSRVYAVLRHPECGDTYYGGGDSVLFALFTSEAEALAHTRGILGSKYPHFTLLEWREGDVVFLVLTAEEEKAPVELHGIYTQSEHFTVEVVDPAELCNMILGSAFVNA